MKTEIINVNLNTFSGTIPSGFDLVEYEKGTCPIDDGYVLYGFDEIGLMVETNAQHAFVKI